MIVYVPAIMCRACYVIVYVPAIMCRACSEKKHTVIEGTPGQGGEAALTIELGSSQEVQVGDTARDDHLSGVTRTNLWICGRTGGGRGSRGLRGGGGGLRREDGEG